MRYEPINAKLFVENRKRLVKELKSKSVCVFNSNDIMPTSADGTMPFKQHSDIFYLSGIDQEESILVLCPDANLPEHREILFLKQTSELIEIWEGHKYTKKEAFEASGIKTVYWLEQFPVIFNALMAESEHVYLNTNEHLRAVVEVETRDSRFIKSCQQKYPLHRYERLAPIMHKLRAIKSKYELDVMQKAINLTAKAFDRVLKFVEPGVYEYEIEAEITHEFIRNRSKGHAYTPIIASGYNACVLHYIDNSQQCKAGEVILMDFGAEYGNYTSDMTRCVPVSGKFTKRQKEVYTAVLNVMKAATKMLKVGTVIDEYHREVGKVMEKELEKIGLLSKADIKNQDPTNPAYKKYFMHGTSHFLGLDVHDVGNKYKPMKEGMVFTCEPGIYIREEKLGIRLENDILITKKGNIDLMAHIPLEINDIEKAMNKK
jgi:Xaa-Pro aminopeptidase